MTAQQPFEDRFDPDRYVDDPVVGVLCEPGEPDVWTAEAWIPERIYRRLFLMGRAYEMHYLGLVPGDSDPVYLNSVQAAGLVDELDFLAGVANDPVLGACIREATSVVVAAARSGAERVLRIEGN